MARDSFGARLARLRVFRPGTIAHLLKSGEATHRDVKEAVRAIQQLQEQLALAKDRHEQKQAALTAQVSELSEALGAVTLRERQLRAILRADAELEWRERELDSILQAPDITAQVKSAIAAAPLREEPFPHIIVDNLFPAAFYHALIRGLPPADVFADRAVNKQQLTVPFALAPRYGQRVWGFMAYVVAPEIIAPAMAEKFRGPMTAWLQANFTSLSASAVRDMPLSCSDGRVLLRRPGYHIPPHRDPKWGFLTCLLYLARPGDSECWGTDLYRVRDDAEARGAKPHWIDQEQCEFVERVDFRPNRALMFLNSVGAHSATIPADAQPADLERYAYQFRVGATKESIRDLMASLPPERRPLWEGKIAVSY